MGNVEVLELKKTIDSHVDQLTQKKENPSDVEGILRELNGALDRVKTEFGDQLKEFQKQFDEAANAIREITIGGPEESEEVQKVIRGTSSRLDILRTSMIGGGAVLGAAVEKKTNWFSSLFSGYFDMREKAKADASFTEATEFMQEIEESGVLKEKKGFGAWMLGLFKWFNGDAPQRKELAVALMEKGYEGIEFEKGSYFNKLTRVHKSKFSGMKLDAFFRAVATRAKEQYPGSKITYKSLLAVADKMPEALEAPKPKDADDTKKEAAPTVANNLLDGSKEVNIAGSLVSITRRNPKIFVKSGTANNEYSLTGDAKLGDLEVTKAEYKGETIQLTVKSKEGTLVGEMKADAVKGLAMHTLSDAQKKVSLLKDGIRYDLTLESPSKT